MFYPFLLTTLAGLATLLGTIPIFFKIKNKNLIISAACSFAGGVMLCISILDLIPESFIYLSGYVKPFFRILLVFLFIVIGITLSMIIDNYVEKMSNNSSLFKVGIISMIAIILHNIPEGIVTFIVTNKSLMLGVSICIAIAMHNIPEGISIAVPIYYSGKSKKQALLYTFISALSEPFGAIITYLFLIRYINDFILGLLFSLIAGIMIQISINKLIPTGTNYQKKVSVIGFLLGFLVMLISLYIG